MKPASPQHVLIEATIENLGDLWDVERGRLKPEEARRVIAPDALVDTTAAMLSLPTRLIQQLGLQEQHKKWVRGSLGESEAVVCDPVRLTVQGRSCTMDVIEVP